ncbi:MAG: hypothetical protein PUJ55_00025 [Clostridiales bacterium]|nr:hypothetical protein [Roseburia sp.]MDD7635303.1 hypothetical protein [Clostridiales bacterium]MDY4113971.1 hypothetical protein [Roseburia sp.]
MEARKVAKIIAEIIESSFDEIVEAHESGDTQAIEDIVYESLLTCE